MQSHHALWIVVFGIATAVTGCVSMKSSGGTMMVDQSDHHRLKSPPAIIATVDGGTPVDPSEFSPTESVKNTITDVLSILGNEGLRQLGRFAERRQQIEHVIRQRVNFLQMAQRALGSPWTNLNDRERQEFVSFLLSWYETRWPTRLAYITTIRFSISMNNVRATLPRSEPT